MKLTYGHSQLAKVLFVWTCVGENCTVEIHEPIRRRTVQHLLTQNSVKCWLNKSYEHKPNKTMHKCKKHAHYGRHSALFQSFIVNLKTSSLSNLEARTRFSNAMKESAYFPSESLVKMFFSTSFSSTSAAAPLSRPVTWRTAGITVADTKVSTPAWGLKRETKTPQALPRWYSIEDSLIGDFFFFVVEKWTWKRALHDWDMYSCKFKKNISPWHVHSRCTYINSGKPSNHQVFLDFSHFSKLNLRIRLAHVWCPRCVVVTKWRGFRSMWTGTTRATRPPKEWPTRE